MPRILNRTSMAGLAAITGLLIASPGPVQAVSCATDVDSCAGTHTSILAISHSFTQPETHVLFRVEVAAWSPGTRWGDGKNGFFYRATAKQPGGVSTVTDYVPFNGIRLGDDSGPALPAFTFIVPVDVSVAGTSLEIDACSSDPTANSSSTNLECKTTYWTPDTFDPLPTPTIMPNPPFFSLGFGDTGSSVSVAANGVYTDHLELVVGSSLSQEDLDWLLDHLVFFDDFGNAYTNEIHAQGVGIVTLDEATYMSPQDQQNHTRYGTGGEIIAPSAPNEELFFYTTLPQTTKVGVTAIYDQSSTCTGYITNNGSQNENCSSRTTEPPSISPTYEVAGNAWKPTANAITGTVAGTKQTRTVQMQVQTTSTDTSSRCKDVLNPLAIAPATVGAAQRPPNYVIDDADWTRTFPTGLYYVLGTGFGNCSLGSAAPFCEQTSVSGGYQAYVPHYDAGAGGSLNGGSTTGRVVTTMQLADEYEIGDINDSAQNGLVFFDSCGYGHSYEEPNVNVGLGTRQELPDAPKNYTTMIYTIVNSLGRAIVFGKECCASWYQSNDQSGDIEPIQQLGEGFGLFLPSGASAQYETFFTDEATAVYDAATGEPLFKLRLKGSSSVVHSCSDTSASVVVSGSGSSPTVKLGGTGSGAKKCQAIGKCPLGMSVATSGSLVTCTRKNSSFLFALDDWQAQASLPGAIQLRAHGGTGHKGPQDGPDPGGAHGFALTVYRPSKLPDGLYAYTGTNGNQNGDGGSSTILSLTPLSVFGSDVAESTIDPSKMDVLLIAGGGGGAGTKHDGGNGGSAHANNQSVPGGHSSVAGQDGSNDNGGKGGNRTSDHQGTGGSTAGKKGVGGTSHGTSADWDKTGPLIPPTVDPLKWDAGHGAHGNASAGGGGFGGGGHGSTNGAGGGGGGSWAAGNTAYDSTAPTGRPGSPNGSDGAVQIAYVAPTAVVAPAPLPSSAQRNVVRFTYDTSVLPLDIATVVERILGPAVSGEVPVYIEAWGGGGGNADAGAGAGGYARSSYLLSDLLAMAGGDGLYLYVGEPGAGGESVGEAGQGGASTVVSTEPIGDQRDDVVLIAGGGGGGGAGTATDDPTAQPGAGGEGGVAIATAEGDASCGGADGTAVAEDEPTGGGGGNGGGGSCDPPRDGAAGTAGAEGGASGVRGIGGFGGITGGAVPAPRWRDAGISQWDAGGGGASSSLGGGGAGGFGGGGSAGESVSLGEGAGGGGGGSWARQATIDDTGAPVIGPLSPSAGSGSVTLTFDICVVHPESRLCADGVELPTAHDQVRTFDGGDGVLRVELESGDSFDVTETNLERFLYSHAALVPFEVSEPGDADGDGVMEIELLFEAAVLESEAEEVVHCLYGAQLDATPFVGCSRVEAAACAACAREECIDDVCVGDAPAPEAAEDDSCAITKNQNTSPFLPLFAAALLLLRRRALCRNRRE